MAKRELKEKCDNCGQSLVGKWKAWHSSGMLAGPPPSQDSRSESAGVDSYGMDAYFQSENDLQVDVWSRTDVSFEELAPLLDG